MAQALDSIKAALGVFPRFEAFGVTPLETEPRLKELLRMLEARLALLIYCVLKHTCCALNRLTLARPTAAPTANIALQRHQCRSHCHSALLV